MSSKKQIKVKLVRSLNGRLANQVASIRGLGLRKINQEVLVEDTPPNRGMINKAAFMLEVKEV